MPGDELTGEKSSDEKDANDDVEEPTASTPSDISTDSKTPGSSARQSPWRRVLSVVNYKPPWIRWDPDSPPRFSLAMNLLFAFSAAFTVANLYYSHPILNVLAKDFNVSYETSARVPTLAQAGYATGLLMLCPLADVFKRRPFVLFLVWLTATLWIGLCITKSFIVFEVITFITAVTTVTPQLVVPLVADLAPTHRRGLALGITTAGFLLGMLIARLLSGVVTNYISWRVIYWIAFGLQYLIFALLWLFMPDYPSTNPDGINYFRMLWSMVPMLKKHPVLVQACLVSMCMSATFTSYWTTLTFLLAEHYGYSSADIGLWALIGIAGVCTSPFFGRFVDKFVPLFSALVGVTANLVGTIVGTYSGLHSPVGVGMQAYLLDTGLQMSQVANRTAIYAVESKGRNRINTVYMLAVFFGQIMGTAAGNRVYAQGGWVASGSLSVGFLGFAIIVGISRGPREKGWFGWKGGWKITKDNKMSADGNTEEVMQYEKRVKDEEVALPVEQNTESAGDIESHKGGLTEAGEPTTRSDDSASRQASP